MMYAGDEDLALQDAYPEEYDGDPLDYPCDECGAEPGDECRPYCTSNPDPS